VKRFLLNFGVALSVALCLATLLLWAASVPRQRAMRIANQPGRARFIFCERGVVYYAEQRAGDPATGAPLLDVGELGAINLRLPTRGGGSMALATLTRPDSLWGFGAGWFDSPDTRYRAGPGPDFAAPISFYIAGAPLWAPAAVTALPPLLWTLARVRRRRRMLRTARGLCLACGYDLRGSPGRCPECGAVASVRNAP
jgi:hypothetical protein